jgi:hypothetical protein
VTWPLDKVKVQRTLCWKPAVKAINVRLIGDSNIRPESEMLLALIAYQRMAFLIKLPSLCKVWRLLLFILLPVY